MRFISARSNAILNTDGRIKTWQVYTFFSVLNSLGILTRSVVLIHMSFQKGQSKFSCVIFKKRSRCDFRTETPSLNLVRFLFRATLIFFNFYSKQILR